MGILVWLYCVWLEGLLGDTFMGGFRSMSCDKRGIIMWFIGGFFCKLGLMVVEVVIEFGFLML